MKILLLFPLLIMNFESFTNYDKHRQHADDIEVQKLLAKSPEFGILYMNKPIQSCQDAISKISQLVGERKIEKSVSGERVRENLKNKNYIAALKNILEIIFFNGGKTNFNEFKGNGFITLDQHELQRIYEMGISDNPQVQELKEKIEVTDNVNEKLGFGFLITQIEDYIERKKKGTIVPDIDLLTPHVQPGSIILMRQEREEIKIDNRIGDAGMISNDNKTISDFTHAAMVTGIENGKPMIIHATMDKGVHSEPLESYLANFPRTNIVALSPKDSVFGNRIANSCIKYSGMKYDKNAPVEQFLGSVYVGDNQNKTNCVEFIADSLFALDSKYDDIQEVAHPNDLLNVSRNGYEVSYVKTYRRNKFENDARAKRIFSVTE